MTYAVDIGWTIENFKPSYLMFQLLYSLYYNQCTPADFVSRDMSYLNTQD